jgi:hypothetical protein
MDRKERGRGKEKPFFCSIGEKLREKKEDGGNNFPLSPPFYFPPQLEGNGKRENLHMEPHDDALFLTFSLVNQTQ